jgi:hypothetical protein
MSPRNGSRRDAVAAGYSVGEFSNAAEPSQQTAQPQAAARSRTELAAVWPPTATVARQTGHHRQSPLTAIRAKCLDCSGGSFAEARRCEAVSCPLWPFRAGRHPWLGFSEKPPSDSGDFQQGGAFYGGPRVVP